MKGPDTCDMCEAPTEKEAMVFLETKANGVIRVCAGCAAWIKRAGFLRK